VTAVGPPPEPDGGTSDLEQVNAPRSAWRRDTVGRPASWWQRLVGIAVLFAVWELAGRTGWMDKHTLPAPSTVLDLAWEMTRDGTLPSALWASSRRVLLALVVGAPVGAALALVAGQSRAGDAVVDANLQVLRYVPILALQPLLIRWLGVGETTKITLLGIGVAFPVYVNTYAAVRGIDARYHDLADVLHLTRRQRLRRVVVPGALPGFMVGFRYAAAVAWLLLIVAEQINANDGLGRLTAEAQAFLRTDRIVVVILMYALLGVTCDLAIRGAELWVLRWRRRR
jgi:sulfonate transport system permease protein